MIPRTTYSIGIKSYGEGAEDAHGNSVGDWGDPVATEVYAIAPRYSNEPTPGRDEVIVGLTILAPPGVEVGPLDRVVIDGEEWEVEGEVGNWNRGPFAYYPGVSFDLKRAEG